MTRVICRKFIRNMALFLGIYALVLGLGTPPTRAQLRVDITKGVSEPMVVAITPFVGANDADSKLGQNLSEIIANDLVISGLFRPLPAKLYPPDAKILGTNPVLAPWKEAGALALMAGTIKQSDGKVMIEFRLWDSVARTMIEGQSVIGQKTDFRRIAHKVADFIYRGVTGEEGYFDTQIIYVTESGNPRTRIKQIAIMDQDGANNRILTDPRVLTITPRFAPNKRVIAYMSYYNYKPRVYVFDLVTGSQDLVGDFPGMTFAPRFSPDGKKVIMSLANNGRTDIYTLDLATRVKKQLTSSGAIDTSPCYSPDGKQIVFNSDRGGSQQLYVMNADGSNARRISFGDGNYATPVWSPRGDLIAFTKMYKDKFNIGVITPDGSRERILATDYLVEGPSWSPNGRVITFFRQTQANSRSGGATKLQTIDITGRNLREIPTLGDASDPAWSPLIP
ncbi:MAG: Tol-Pal system beta propeller repeat protein TolB [Alphaproteobacteria bacterium]|nr:Tol-Pal system beta propeller repeat protein TolB [Alphaproteobacteria bacterium]